jgi:8-oxo-dGTP pyrophosphatase MutT (NUDIX family)
MHRPAIQKKVSLASGKWLELKTVYYIDRENRARSWETVERLRCHGAALMVAVLKPSNRLILIKQYRPPAERFIIEFPAGLIDPGEPPEETAVRELLEETGYNGKIVKSWAPSYSSPGMTGETVRMYFMEVDENSPENLNVSPSPEEGEHIETELVELEKLQDYIDGAVKEGASIDSKVLSFAVFQAMGRNI